MGKDPLGGVVNERGGDERELVRRCRDGSESAYAELVRAHRPRLYALAFRLTNDSGLAEDVVQETFLAAFRSIEKVEPDPSLAPWLNTIAIRAARKAAGRRNARTAHSLDRLTAEGEPALGELAGRPGDPSADPYEAARAAEIRGEIAAAIAELPFRHRVAVVLRFVMGLDYAEAAATAGIPLNTFKSDLLRGTRALRTRLDGRLGADTGSEFAFPSSTPPAIPGAYIPPGKTRGTVRYDGHDGGFPGDRRAVTHAAAAGMAGRDRRA